MTENRTPIRVGFYDIEKTIGKGNFAVVKLARHRLTKNEVAIKIIDKTQLSAPDLRRAYREVRVLKKLYHPHIIRLYQLLTLAVIEEKIVRSIISYARAMQELGESQITVMETKNMLYIVTEYAPKGEIFEHIANHGRLPEPFARRIYWQVVSAVDYCHKRGVVHRDLKAENLLLDAEGCVKLADFGFSTWWSQDAMLSTWCGSPPYAAPEVFEGRQYMGPEIDIWSLGVVLYVLVCGALPFDASTLPSLRERVLSARFRVPYFMSAECESLVRKMLMKDPARRYSIDQVKQHAWMQADRPPRLLPAPGQPPPPNTHKQYLDPGLAPDVVEPNEQILRLMASLGIDSSRTKESLQQQSYDHHAAIYFLLLERLRQHPGGKLAGTGVGRAGPGAVRMMSQDSSTCRKMPRRPSTIAETAMRKMGPVPGPMDGQQPQQAQAAAQPQAQAAGGPCKSSYPVPPYHGGSSHDHNFWKAQRPVHAKVGQSQGSSVDEGVADMDSSWEPDLSGSIGTIDRGSSSSSGFMHSNPSAASTASRSDWKWPTAGCSGYSIPNSSDSPKASGSPGESIHGSSTTLSSWDSAWEPATGLAVSLPSCTQNQSTSVDTRRFSSIETETPKSPESSLTTGRLWLPEVNNLPQMPTEFTLGRRASDGLIGGRRITHFTNKLDGARAGGISELTETDANMESESRLPMDQNIEDTSLPDSQFLALCSPAKRPSIPDARSKGYPVGNVSMPSRDPGPGPSSSHQWSGNAGSSHLHKQLMSLRLQRRTSGDPGGDMMHSMDSMDKGRKSVLRQQSYKLAQQQPVMSPLHGQSSHPFLPPDLESCMFRPLCSEDNRLHCHEEEQEEEEDAPAGTVDSTSANRMGLWPNKEHTTTWQNLPVTMSDCKLTDSNTSLSRLSPLLQFNSQEHGKMNSTFPSHQSTIDWKPTSVVSSTTTFPTPTFLTSSQPNPDTSNPMNPRH